MRRIRDVLRLKFEAGLSDRTLAAAVGISKGAVAAYVYRARAAGLSWPLPAGLDDTALERRLFPGPPAPEAASRAVPDWAGVERELRRRGVTRALLWQEYRAQHPDGFGYSWFCEAYDAWKGQVSPTMRQSHVGGEKVFVDFAGDTMGVVDPGSGEVWQAKLFVACMGASSLVFAEARPGKPRDKAKVEQSVLLAERWIMARLRHARFFSLAELNAAVIALTAELNARIMRGFGASRAELFASLDAPALHGLRTPPYAFARWRRCRVGPDYHVEADGHWYSVPFRLIRQLVDLRIGEAMLEVFHKGERVGSHVRVPHRRGHTTIPEHMPDAHRRHAQWTPARLLEEAGKVGSSTMGLCEAVMAARPHPEQGFRTCLGILGPARTYGAARLEAACGRGIGIGIRARTVTSIRSILQTGLDRACLGEEPDRLPPPLHGNIRGGGYFH